MFLKLFHATVVVFLAIISIVLFAVLLTGLISIIESSMLGGGYGTITAVSGGVSERLFRFLVIAGSLLVAGIFLLWRRRRLR